MHYNKICNKLYSFYDNFPNKPQQNFKKANLFAVDFLLILLRL